MTGDVMEESYEILDISGTSSRNHLLNQALNAIRWSFEKYPVASKTTCGAAGGYITGLLFRKVGKVAATAVGGGLLFVQIGCRTGYITINTNRVRRDARNLQRTMEDGMSRHRSSISEISAQIEQLVRRNVPFVVGSAAGFLLGLAS